MSRLANKPLVIPAKTTVSVEGDRVVVKGPKGELARAFPSFVTFTVSDGGVTVALAKVHRDTRPMLGTSVSHLRNMIIGVTEGYEKKLLIEGVGFKADAKGSDLHLALGFSHPVVVPVPTGITCKTEKGVITLAGIDKEALGAFAASVRALKEPEPYKGKGIRYSDEVIRRKQGKKSS
jgi:large subunit ribosomal protein L6